MFSHIERVTIVNKLRSFQFKYLHRILFFNDKLYRWKLTNSTLCDFCSEELDSIEHRYFYCRITQAFWNDISEWVAIKFNTKCTFSNPEFITTNICSSDMSLMETLMLNAKYYIYLCFIKKTIPRIAYYKCIIEDLEKTEQYLASEKNKLCYHNQKWNKNE